MAVRSIENRWPRFKDNTTLLQKEDLGLTDGDINDYVLVSYQSKRLWVNHTNIYVVFVLIDTQIAEYRWTIKKFDWFTAVFNNTEPVHQETTLVGEFSWQPQQEHSGERLEISVELIGADKVVKKTLNLIQNVFDELSDSEILNEVAAQGLMRNPPVVMADPAGAGNITLAKKVIYSFWEYIIYETYRDEFNPKYRIPPILIAAIILRSIYLTTPKYSALQMDGAIDGDKKFNANFWLPNQEVTLAVASMFRGVISWKEKSEDNRNEWIEVEKRNVDDFDSLDKEVQIDTYNFLRFPKLYVKLIAESLRRIRATYLTDRDITVTEKRQRIVLNYIKHATVGIPEVNLESGLQSIISFQSIFLSSIFDLPNFKLTNNPYGDLTQVNLRLNDNSGAVRQLKEDLLELGFRIAREHPDDIGIDPVRENENWNRFYLRMEWAVREFQIYAKMKFIAKEKDNNTAATPIHQRLRRYPNLCPYAGPVSGVANEETLRLVRLWKAMRWRCPVVISAWRVNTNTQILNPAIHHLAPGQSYNIWTKEGVGDDPNAGWEYRYYAQDFTNYYKVPNNRIQEDNIIFGDGFIVTGKHLRGGTYVNGDEDAGALATPVRYHTWNNLRGAGTEVTPYSFQNIGPFSEEFISTFKVVRAVAEQECIGYFDAINAYDRAYMSFGPCHWTLAIRFEENNPATPEIGSIERGEMCALLSYFKNLNLSGYKKIFLNFGFDVSPAWPIPIEPTHRKYTGVLRIQTDVYGFQNYVSHGNYNDLVNLHNSSKKLDYFRSWHWVYRFIIACRIDNTFQRAMWDMARIRINDILNSRLYISPDASYRIGDIYTSERAIALIYRMHIYQPARIINGPGRIQNTLYHAFTSARNVSDIIQNRPFDRWGNEEEIILIDHLLPLFNAVNNTCQSVFDWPIWYQPDIRDGTPIINCQGRNPINCNRYTFNIMHFDNYQEADAAGNPTGRRLRNERNSFRFLNI